MDLSYTSIWKIAYPIFVSMLLQQIVGITDVIFLGHLGEIALSGAALGSTYFLTIFMVAIGFTVGAQIIMARRNGEQNYQKIGPVFYQATACLAAASVLIVIVSHFFSSFILQRIISSPEVFEATISYVNWRFWGFIPLFIVIMIRSFFVSITQTKVLTHVSLFTVICNVTLNYILIFGRCGFPQMGIAGAALASSLSEAFSLIFLLVYCRLNINFAQYGLDKIVYKNFRILREILDLSVWTMLQQFISLSAWFFFFVAIERLGSTQLAVSNILRSVSAFPFIIINALAITTGTLVSNLIGAGRDDKVIYCCNKLILLAGCATGGLILFLVIARSQILGLYTPDEHIINYAKSAYLVMLGSQIPYIPALILFNALMGAGHPKKAMFIEFVANVSYIIYVFWIILYLRADIAWCWTADYTCNIVILVMSAYYMYRNKWCCRIV